MSTSSSASDRNDETNNEDDVLPISVVNPSILQDNEFEQSERYSELQESTFLDDAAADVIDTDMYTKTQMGYDATNPTLFSETYSMAFSAAAIFSMAEVRQAARNGIIDAPEVITLPVSVYAITEAFGKHRDILRKKMKKADFDFIESMRKQMAGTETMSGVFISNIIKSATLEYFGDDDTKSECVHLVARNSHINRISVCFRGTITLNDWVKDSKVVVGYIQNPLLMNDETTKQEVVVVVEEEEPKQQDTEEAPEEALLGVHLGFREYLYDESKSTSLSLDPIKEKLDNMREKVSQRLPKIMFSSSSMSSSFGAKTESKRNNSAVDASSAELPTLSSSGDNSNNNNNNNNLSPPPTSPVNDDQSTNLKNSRIARILEEVEELRKKYPDYKIYCTGHSLGGALAQLTAIELAVRWGKPENPVTYVGIGNPRAATYSFRDAIQILEKEGKMRCLGIHNHHDIVPMIPTSAMHVQKKNTFCQVGFQMLLLQHGRCEMKYCPETAKPWQELKDQTNRMAAAVFRPDKIAGRHHYLTYLSKLRALEVPLSKLYLNDYYNEIVKPDLFPGSEKKVTPANVTTEKGSLATIFAGQDDVHLSEHGSTDN
jgi:hypothetical protein